MQQQEVGAAVVDLLVEKLPGYLQLPNPRSQPQAGPPGNRNRQDVDGVAHFEQGAAEGEVGVVVGHEPVGARGVHDEQDHRPDAAARQLGQLEQVPPAARGHRIGEHGDAVAVKGAGLHLEVELAAAPGEQEIEAAAANADLAAGYLRSRERGDAAAFDQAAGDGVGQPCVKEDEVPVPLDGDRGIAGLAADRTTGSPPVFGQVHRHPGEQQLPHPPRVRQEGADEPAAGQPAAHEELVGPVDEAGLQQLPGYEPPAHRRRPNHAGTNRDLKAGRP